ncbi:MAG: AmmeMemoRadiSam system protein B [Armatimonadia bacterium]|nr:AmmeMemoRadiSam system protein B [Armatimonadia bacterium]
MTRKAARTRSPSLVAERGSPLAPSTPPRSRMLAPSPIEVEGEQYVLIEDPEGIVPEGFAISPPMYLILALCDGQRTPEDIQAALVAELGSFIAIDEVSKALDELARHGLLQCEAVDERLRDRLDAYRAGPRAACHAGAVYPAAEAELRSYLDELLARSQASLPEGVRVECLVAPHIDFQRGARIYADAYAAARDHVRAETFIVLGVAHAPTPGPFILTRQPFETPLGTMEVDAGAADQIASALGEAACDGELLHEREHSVEFQAVWLKHLFPKAKMVAVLCSHLDAARPGSLEAANALASRIREMRQRDPGRYCVVAGVDLSHVGPDFGHSKPAGADEAAGASEVDHRVMTSVLAGHADGVLEACLPGLGEEDPNVCGQAALHVAAKCMSPCMGSAIQYGQAPTPSGQSVVGFCAAALWPRPEA